MHAYILKFNTLYTQLYKCNVKLIMHYFLNNLPALPPQMVSVVSLVDQSTGL